MGTLGSIQQAELSANSDIMSATESKAGTLGSLDVMGERMNSSLSGGAQAIDWAATHIFGLETNDFVGIAGATGVENMKNAIDAYCNAVTSKIEQIVATANPEGTFAGQYANDINTFIKAIKDSCLSTVNNLKLFKKDLDEVYTAMTTHDTTVGESISTDASSINSNVGTETN